VSNPYRVRPKDPPARSTDPARLRLTTFVFGFVCVVLGVAVSGKDRARCMVLGALGGAAALLARPRTC
jgi:hypothetical protein